VGTNRKAFKLISPLFFMNIIAVRHKVEPTQKMDAYLQKIADAVSFSPNVVLGTDYGLMFLDENGKIRFDLRDQVIGKLEEISSKSPQTLIVPGTCPVRVGESGCGLSSLIFRGGKKIAEFRKETCAGDDSLAKENGLKYVRGCSDNNHLKHEGKIVAVEICRDHGKQRIPKDTFVELIQSYDDNAGFYVTPTINDFDHFAVISDGRIGIVGGYRYNPSEFEKYFSLKKEEVGPFLFRFNLNK
jgi:hypothetical protein